MGLNCKILQTSINSNTIQVWYTTDIPFRGTPQANVGVPDGLVLKVVRNGDMVQEATAIRPEKKADAPLFPESWGETMDASDFQYTINQSVVISIPVFSEQRICFNGAKLPEEMNDQECYKVCRRYNHSEESQTARLCSQPDRLRGSGPILRRGCLRPHRFHFPHSD